MKGLLLLALGLLAITSCKGDETGDAPPSKDDAAAQRPTAKTEAKDIPLSFGDCASEYSRFASGPRPRPVADVLGNESALDDMIRRDKPRSRPVVGDTAKPTLDPRRSGILGVAEGGESGAFGLFFGDTDFVDGPGDFRAPHRQGTGGIGIRGGSFSGRGGGYGVMPSRLGPVFRIGRTTVTGDLNKNVVRRFVRRKVSKLRACYLEGLKKSPTLAGKISIAFQIAPSGRVLKSSATGLGNKRVHKCFARAVKQITFPKPKNSGTVQVASVFTVSPPPKSGPRPPAVHRPIAPKDKGYEPGRSSPIRSVDKEIKGCLATSALAHGVAVVQFRVSSLGEVTEATAFGSEDAVNDCLAASVRAMRVPASDRPTRSFRCPLAFGALDLGKAPGIDISASAVVLDETSKVATDEVHKGEVHTLFTPLIEALRKRQRQWFSSKRVVSVTGPLVVRPIGTTPAKVLLRVLLSAYHADARAVLAVRRGGQWSLLRDNVALPRTPIRLGAGAALSRPGFGRGGGRKAVIAIMATKQAVVIGTASGPPISIANDNGKPDVPTLKARLMTLRKTPTLAIEDIDITAGDEVAYADLVSVVEAAQDAGFSGWRLAVRRDINIGLDVPAKPPQD